MISMYVIAWEYPCGRHKFTTLDINNNLWRLLSFLRLFICTKIA